MISVHRYDKGAEENPLLRALIFSEMQRFPSSRLGVGDGWTGPKTLFAEPATQGLQALIRGKLPPCDWSIFGWGNVLNAGDQIQLHAHIYPGNVWSGVYYPETGGGPIEFETGERLEPEASTLIVFPSHLKHRVIATGERLSIAFNART